MSTGKASTPTHGNEGEAITRRRFCNHALLTAAGLAVAVTSSKGESLNQHSDLLFYPPAKVEGAERLMPGSSMYFDYPKANDLAILVRTPEGEYSAYSRKCPHLGCSIEFDNSRRCLTCPCHRGAYDARTGHVIFGPPPRPLDQVILQVRGGGEVWAVGRRIGNANNNA